MNVEKQIKGQRINTGILQSTWGQLLMGPIFIGPLFLCLCESSLSQCAIYSHLNRNAARLIIRHLRIAKRAEVEGQEQMVPQESPQESHRDPS